MMYDDDNDTAYYFQQRQRIIKTVVGRAVTGGKDPLSKNLRHMMGMERKGDRDDDRPQQPREHKDAPQP